MGSLRDENQQRCFSCAYRLSDRVFVKYDQVHGCGDLGVFAAGPDGQLTGYERFQDSALRSRETQRRLACLHLATPQCPERNVNRRGEDKAA